MFDVLKCLRLAGLILSCLLACLPAALHPSAVAAQGGKPVDSQPKPAPNDPLGRSTPYGTVMGFIVAAARNDYPGAIAYLEGTQSPEKKMELARVLYLALNRGGVRIKVDSLSRESGGRSEDNLAPDMEKVGEGKYGEQTLDILLRRVPGKDALPIWLFSSQTLASLPRIVDALEVPLGERIWPAWFQEREFLGVPAYMLANWVVIFPALLVLSLLLVYVVRSIARPLLLRRLNADEDDVAAVTAPLTFLTFSLLLSAIAPLATSIRYRLFFTSAASILIIVALTWILIRGTRLAADLRVSRLARTGFPAQIPAVRLLSWILMALWAGAGLVLVVQSLGLDPTTTLAGLGVGGIAIAFAAQKSIENLFGTLMVIGDDAIRVGDTCRVGNIEGRVESIGIRATQIRTADRSLVTVPNGQLAAMNVANLQRRDKILFTHLLRLDCRASAAQLRSVLEGIRSILARHARVEQGTQSVQFVQIGDTSFDIQIRAYLLTRQQSLFLECQEELLLQIMDLVEASGAELATASQAGQAGKESGA